MEEGHAQKGTEVFVGGLAKTVSENKVREVFSSCGEILEIRLIKDPQGTLKGFCFVRFATKDAADRAIREKAGITLEGRKIGVLPSTERDTLYLGNLNKAWSAEEFEQIVRQVFPDVVSVDLKINKGMQPGKTQWNRGFGFVKFSSYNAASRAQRVSSRPEFCLGNSHPKVEWAEEEPEADKKELDEIKIAFVRNLPADADESFLQSLFEPFGQIEKTVVSRKGSSPLGFVYFMRRSDLDRSIKELNEKTLRGPTGNTLYKLEVEVARPFDKSKKRVRDNSESSPAIQSHAKALKEEPNFIVSNNRGSYVYGQELTSTDPYEDAVISLPLAVKERLLRILRLGIATRFDLDVKSLRSLNEIPESNAITVLDKFMLSGANCLNKGAFLDGLISKYLVDKVEQRQGLVGLTRAADNTVRRDTELFSFPTQLSPSVGSLAPHTLPILSRAEFYALHGNTSTSLSDNSLSSQTLVERAKERGSDYLISNGVIQQGPSRTLFGRAGSDYLTSNHSLSGTHQLSTHHGLDFDMSNEALSRHNQIANLQRTTTKLEDTSSDYHHNHHRLISNQPISGGSHQIQTTGVIEEKVPDYRHLLSLSNQHMRNLQGTSKIDDIASGYLLPNRHQGIQQFHQELERNRSPLERTNIEEHIFSPHEVIHNNNTSTSYGRFGVSSVSEVPATLGNQQGARVQVKFDPFTGQPYKFDPFTGEPIRQ